jgi:hypothetical protein
MAQALTVAGIAMFAFDAAQTQARSPAAQTDSQPAPQRVERASELKPISADEQTRATFYARERTSDMTVQELVDLGGGGLRMQPLPQDPALPFLPVICLGSRPPSLACAVAASPDSMAKLETTLRTRVCASEFLMAGRVVSQKAMLTAGEKALFTDYTVTPEQWLRPSSGPSSLVVSEWGGSLEIAGKPFAIVRPRMTLQAGKRYMLVLGRFPDTAGFMLKADPIELATSGPTAALSEDFLAQVTRAAAKC